MQRPQVSGAGGLGTGTVRCRTEPLFVMHLLNERSWPALLSCAQGRVGTSLQEAIGYPSFHNGLGSLGLLLRLIAEHMSQHLGVEDAARR